MWVLKIRLVSVKELRARIFDPNVFAAAILLDIIIKSFRW